MSSASTGTNGGFTPSVIILSPQSQYFVDNASTSIAPWVMGAFTAMFLQGILITQITHYFTYNIGDPSYRRFTWLVLLVAVLCIIKNVQDIAIVWAIVVTNFANPDAAAPLSFKVWWVYTTSLMTAVIATLVQSFFMYRYWLLTKRWIICGVIVCGMSLSLVAASLVVVSLSRSQFSKMQAWSLTHFVSAIITDTIITSLTAYHLYRQKSRVLSTPVTMDGSYLPGNGLTTMEIKIVQSTSELIDRLLRMIWQSALPPTICVTINCILLRIREPQVMHIAFNMILPMLYAMSLIYTLNTRNELREARSSSGGVSSQSRSHGPSFPLNRRPLSNVQEEGIFDSDGVPVTMSGRHLQKDPGGGKLPMRSNSGKRLDVHIETTTTRKEQRTTNVELRDLHMNVHQLPIKEDHEEELEEGIWGAKKS